MARDVSPATAATQSLTRQTTYKQTKGAAAQHTTILGVLSVSTDL